MGTIPWPYFSCIDFDSQIREYLRFYLNTLHDLYCVVSDKLVLFGTHNHIYINMINLADKLSYSDT